MFLLNEHFTSLLVSLSLKKKKKGGLLEHCRPIVVVVDVEGIENTENRLLKFPRLPSVVSYVRLCSCRRLTLCFAVPDINEQRFGSAARIV